MRGTRRKLALIGSVAVLIALPATAHAAEAVTDGGFEAFTCSGSGCTSTAWGNTGNAYLCHTGYCGTSARNGAGWAQLGTNVSDVNGPRSESGILSQSVPIPAAPASLTFATKVLGGTAGTMGTLSVSIDGGSSLKTIQWTDPGYGSYAIVGPIDVSSYAGGASHTLAFAFTGFAGQNLIPPAFLVDDVSLTVPFLPTPPDPTPTPTPTPTPEPTPTPTPEPQPTAPTCHGKTATKVGTDESELIEGTPQADVIVAGAGDDVIRTGAGDDVVCAGPGNDELKGASGNDRLYGEEGRDKLNGGGGSGDRCVGGPSRDKATPSCEKSKTL